MTEKMLRIVRDIHALTAGAGGWEYADAEWRVVMNVRTPPSGEAILAAYLDYAECEGCYETPCICSPDDCNCDPE